MKDHGVSLFVIAVCIGVMMLSYVMGWADGHHCVLR